MEIKKIYKDILKNIDKWNYYNKDVKTPDILDVNDCKEFIKTFIKYSGKSETILFGDINSLFKEYPNRFYHIVSAFFLGLWLFNHKNSKFLRDSIIDELTNLKCFKDKCIISSKEKQCLHNEIQRLTIEKQFTFVWFMATLFHDLGYPAEKKEEGRELPNHKIPSIEKNSVPDFYKKVYKCYYEKYKKNKEHGIYAGLKFDEDICKIREFQSNNSKTDLDWSAELEELYHYVAWIILSHNIWMIRGDDDEKIKVYKENHLNELILSSGKDEKGQYKEYKISFEKYPLFTFFCIIDTIEPLKSTSCLSKVDIQLKGKKIIIKSNDSVYLQKILELNKWILPVSKENDMVTINLTILQKK